MLLDASLITSTDVVAKRSVREKIELE